MTQSRLFVVVIGVPIVALALGSCERRREGVVITAAPQALPTAIGGGPVDAPTAVARIVEARCVREAFCGLIGKKWASNDACLEVVSREYADDLTDEDCPEGIDGKGLAACVEATRTADCSKALDVIGRVPACHKSELCRR